MNILQIFLLISPLTRLRKLKSLSQARNLILKFYKVWKDVKLEYTSYMQGKAQLYVQDLVWNIFQQKRCGHNIQRGRCSEHDWSRLCLDCYRAGEDSAENVEEIENNILFSRLCIHLTFQMVLLDCSWLVHLMKKLIFMILCKLQVHIH